MRVLGIDPGSETLGWGVVEGENNKYRLIDYGTVKSSASEPFSKRLLKAFDGVAAVIETFKPDVMSVEEVFFAHNVKVALKLGMVRGAVLVLGEKSGLEIAEYSPRLVKQTIVGHGSAEKHQVQEMVKILLRLPKPPQPHDAADALALAICHFHHAGANRLIEQAKMKR
jgi:crossover junction endodeoxyribonuclease RuvC